MRRASPAVAAYPFTTVTPNLGVTQVGADTGSPSRLVLADLPGLIEGAHQVSNTTALYADYPTPGFCMPRASGT